MLVKAVVRPVRRPRALVTIVGIAVVMMLAAPYLRARARRMSLRGLAEAQIHVYAHAAERWRADYPDAACPSSLERLAEYTMDKHVRDVYGEPLVLLCTPKGFVVYSLGEDGRLGTADDLWSSTQ